MTDTSATMKMIRGGARGFTSPQGVENAASLRAELPSFIPQQVFLICHTSKGDGGHGRFYWSDTSTLEDNNGTVFQNPLVPVGRWVRVHDAANLYADWFGPDVIVSDTIDLLPESGGVVNLSIRRYKPSPYHYGTGAGDLGKCISKDNVTLRGLKIPSYAKDCTYLENGSILEGMVLGFANNLRLENLGVDSGVAVCAKYYAGTSKEGLVLTYPSNTSKGASELRTNASIHNVRTLCQSPTAPVHAMIMGEGYKGVSATGIIEGCFGVHGVVIKCDSVTAESIAAYANGDDGLIIKSDFQATSLSTRIAVSTVKVYAGGPPSTVPYTKSTTGTGVYIHAGGGNVDIVQIGSIYSEGHPRGLALAYLTSGSTISNLQIGSITTEANAIVGCDFNVPTGMYLQNSQVGAIVNRNSPVGTSIGATVGSDLSVGTVHTVVCSLGVYLQKPGQIHIGSVSSKSNVEGALRIIAGCTPSIGTVHNAGPGPTYDPTGSGVVAVLAEGVTQAVGNRLFACTLDSFGILLGGLIIPSATGNILCNLPTWARPAFAVRVIAQGNSLAGVQSAVPISIGSNGDVYVNEVAGGTANCGAWLSLDGIHYSLS